MILKFFYMRKVNKKHPNATKHDFPLIDVTKGHNSAKNVQITKH